MARRALRLPGPPPPGGADRVPADIARARAQYAEAVRLRPTDAYPRLLQALLAEKEGDRAAAHAAIDGAVRLDPHNVSIRWEAALLALGWGERATALEHFKYVLGVDPDQRDAAFQLALTLLRPGEDPASLLPTDAAPPEGPVRSYLPAGHVFGLIEPDTNAR